MSRRRPLLEQPPLPSAQRADSEQIVAAVIAAAIELGPQATLAAIAAKAGVGAASLHRYFPTTAAIFAEVSRQSYRTLLEQIRALTNREDLELYAMVKLVCQAAIDGPGLSLEHRRRLNLELPLAWTTSTAEQVYAEVLEAAAGWIRKHVQPPPQDLEARVFVAFANIRGAVLMMLMFPSIAPPREALLPALADSVFLALTLDRQVSQ